MAVPETIPFRSVYILAFGLMWLLLFAAWLVYGQLTGKINLWHVLVDARIRQVGLRLILEVMAFIVGATVVLLIAVKDDGDSAVWALGIFIGTYAARSVIGALAGAKSAVMMHQTGGWMQNQYAGMPQQGPLPTPIRGRAEGP